VGRSVGHEWAVFMAISGHFPWPPVGSSSWPLTPGEHDQWAFEAGYAQNAVAAVAYAARTWLTDEPQEAVWAARQVYEAADYAAQLHHPGVAAYSIDAEERWRHSPVVEGAVSALLADLEAAAQGDPMRVQEQSRVGAGELAPLFP
ncbi:MULTISPECIES: hypothetical protein, partial [unclassified Cryobacterium]|uniref:hypothetical protein n=1 Tax=unclassified Cryobacterium TaxID=2649013 RepID=UPI001A7EBC48